MAGQQGGTTSGQRALVVYMVDNPTTLSGPSRHRTTSYINRKPASNLGHAISSAVQQGLSLNYLVTISFRHTTCDPKEASARFARLRENYFGPWLRRPSRLDKGATTCPPTFVWVLEAEGGIAAHWLVHLPPNRVADFTVKLPRWVRKAIGDLTCEASAIDIREAYNPQGCRGYLLKGIDPVFADFYKVRHVPQGAVIGKRSGFSRNLGPKARQRTGYRKRSAKRFTKLR